jgi:thiamine-phosphate pyrophosphorylase
MDCNSYTELAQQVYNICQKYNVAMAVNSRVDTAEKLSIRNIHIPFKMLEENPELAERFYTGVSVHSSAEAERACKLGAEYIIAGHIFMTDCKKNLEPRGLEYLSEIVKVSSVPVFGIGGINRNNLKSVLDTGAYGFCVMSELMKCSDNDFPADYFR